MRTKCPHCLQKWTKSYGLRMIHRTGRFWRRSDGHWIQRFSCRRCGKSFSHATTDAKYRQKKRHKNEPVRKGLCAGVSQRELARMLKINRKTVVRKLLFLADQETRALQKWNEGHPPALEVEFDDMETFEHSKCKPLSITLMVEHQSRRILGFEVSRMPAKGRLAKIALKKYGFRRDDRSQARRRLFERTSKFVSPTARIRSDSNPHYPTDVRVYFPHAVHETVKGGRGAMTGQGELKKLKFDPIFSLNHTCAMLRANINRLFRRTWCTTKRPDRLCAHIALYAMSHNRRLSTD